jgi:SAM-dependent methyltransferase
MQHAQCHHADAPVSDRPAGDHDDVVAYYREIAPFYDAELEGRDDLDFWRRIAEHNRGGTILELGAGSGRVTEALASAAGTVVAIDLSPEMLGMARRRLSGRADVSLVLADMLDLPFRAAFDAIVAADDPFSHLTEDAERDRALRSAARLLKPGGRFVLDALWLGPKEARAVASVGGRVREHASSLDGQPLRVVERWQRVRDGSGASGRERSCRASYRYLRPGHAPVVARFVAHDWTAAELTARLGQAGLHVHERWGGYRGEPWDPERSQQLIVAARPAP